MPFWVLQEGVHRLEACGLLHEAREGRTA
jgi:hypothetical protein